MKFRKLLAVLFAFALACTLSFAQDEKEKEGEKVLGEVEVSAKSANTDPVYLEFRKLSSRKGAFSGAYATVNNLVLKKDAAIFTLRSGEIYFLEEAQGKRTGAVFLGDGELSIDPPIEAEKRSLKYFTGKPTVNEPFAKLVMFFTDKTFEEVKKSKNVRMSTNGPQAGKAQDEFRAKETLLKTPKFRYNMSTRILMDAYGPERDGFFWAFVKGKKYDQLLFKFDPLGIAEVAPEQVSLTNYDSNNYGFWLAFHSEDEYKNNTASSNTDRRVFDLAHHNIDVTLRGVKIIATDEATMKVLTKGQRVLPFSLYRHLRMKRILDENGEEISFIQEDKNKDSDLAVILPERYDVGKPFKLIFEYEGVNTMDNVGTGTFNLREAARASWYPNNGTSTVTFDAATFELRFRYPKLYTLVGVGELIDFKEDEGGLKFSHWSSKGVEMKVAGFNYGEFKKKELHDKRSGYDLAVYNNKNLPGFIKNFQDRIENEEARRANDPRYASSAVAINVGSLNTSSMANHVLDEALNSVRIFDHYFGKLPHKRISMTQQPRLGRAQAWATLVYMPLTSFLSKTHRNELLGFRAVKGDFVTRVGPHEVSHQWWGHAVGWSSYRDQWMSEGFADLSAMLYIQYVYRDTGQLIKFLETRRKSVVEGTRETNGVKPYTVGPVTQGFRLFTSKAPRARYNLLYRKGSYILHMLRMLMIDPKRSGMDKDERFQKMMRDFVKTHYNQYASTEDFKRIVEKHMPRDLNPYKNGSMDWFFNQWVYGTEVPKYEMQYELGKSGGKTILNAKITQANVSDNFVMPVPIYVDYGKGWVELGKATIVGNKTYEINNVPLPRKPRKVAVAALHDVLATSIKNKKIR